MSSRSRKFTFSRIHKDLAEVLTDHRLASLGDAYINFAYSLALSTKRGQPSGAKVKGTALAEALRRAGLRRHMPSRMTNHKLADAAEALIVYAWLNSYINLDESVTMIQRTDDVIDGLTQLLTKIEKSIKFS